MSPLVLNIRRDGDAGRPPIVLLHGLFGSAANWRGVAGRLAADYRVLVPDLRNHGDSPHASRHDYPSMVSDLVALLDRERIGRAILVGHSMGGKVAMHMALSHPDRLRGLVVVDMAPVRYRHDFDAIFAAFEAIGLDGLRSRAEADAQLARLSLGPGLRGFLLQNLVKRAGIWQWRLNLPALAGCQAEITDFPMPADWRSFEGAVSFIHGTESDYLSPVHFAEIRRLFPNARVCPVAAAGHWVYADQLDRFLVCLSDFLATLPN